MSLYSHIWVVFCVSLFRILHILSPPIPGPVMPADVAVQLYITHSPPLCSFLSSYEDYRAHNLVKGREWL